MASPVSEQRLGGNLSLHIPATVDVECSCFCWKKQKEPTTPVIVHQNSLKAVVKADVQQTSLAVEAVYNEVIRRCHPDLPRATSILQKAGLDILNQPRYITAHQVRIIQEQFEGPQPESSSSLGSTGSK